MGADVLDHQELLPVGVHLVAAQREPPRAEARIVGAASGSPSQGGGPGGIGRPIGLPFPNAGDGEWPVSVGGGAEPLWSRDGPRERR